jgi:hypothetical protein
MDPTGADVTIVPPQGATIDGDTASLTAAKFTVLLVASPTRYDVVALSTW